MEDVNWHALTQQYCEYVRIACTCCGMPMLPPRIEISWSPRFTARMGSARWDPSDERGQIRLSKPLWPLATDSHRREVVFHEACHIITMARNPRCQPHGLLWKQMMACCGYPAAGYCTRLTTDQRRKLRSVRRAGKRTKVGSSFGRTLPSVFLAMPIRQ